MALCADLLILFCNCADTQAQTDSTVRAFQFTFITPLGTNGVEAANKTNTFSINLLAGYNGGLKGVELGGFVNILKGSMDGVQLAGYSNVNLSTGKGFQGAGFLNYNHREFNGAQISGCTNIALATSSGFQGSGFANVVKGSFEGAQISGFANVVTDSIVGFQGAGVVNYAKRNTRGQLAGFANFNFSDIHGAQLSGCCNMNVGNCTGAQVAGVVNINVGAIRGAQVAGLLNYTKRLSGLQLGIFNYVDSIESGMAIGVLSFVRNGYHQLEVSANESMSGVISYKTGTKGFYNILSAGVALRDNSIYWGFGYGVGTIIPVKGRFELDIEAICFQVNSDDHWDSHRLNLHNRINVLGSVRLTDRITVFGGPAWNVLVADIEGDNGELINSDYAPWHVFDKTYSNRTNVKMYPGFSVGVRF